MKELLCSLIILYNIYLSSILLCYILPALQYSIIAKFYAICYFAQRFEGIWRKELLCSLIIFATFI